MSLDPITVALFSAIGALASVVAYLHRENRALHQARLSDKNQSAKLIFALLQKRRDERGEPPPPTATEWQDEPTTKVTERAFLEAEAHARSELNGELEELCRRYLSNTPSPIPTSAPPPWRVSSEDESRARGPRARPK